MNDTVTNYHVDMVGTQIKIGDVLVMSHRHYNEVELGRVVSMSTHRVRVVYLLCPNADRLVNPKTTIIADGPNVMAYILRHSG